MTTSKHDWSIESALEIVEHPTVDSKIWSEAVEWLLLNGPPEIQQLLQGASGHATTQYFPDLKPEGFTATGEPCYDIAKIAASLNISEEEALQIISKKENKHGVQQIFPGEDTHKIQ